MYLTHLREVSEKQAIFKGHTYQQPSSQQNESLADSSKKGGNALEN